MKILRKLLTSVLIPLTLTAATWAEPEFVQPDQYVQYATVQLTSDLSHLNSDQKQAVVEMIKAAQVMDRLFWLQAYGNPESLQTMVENPKTREYVRINYGPWDRLQGNRPFVEGFGEKPLGARF